jgi:hypothetical protein
MVVEGKIHRVLSTHDATTTREHPQWCEYFDLWISRRSPRNVYDSFLLRCSLIDKTIIIPTKMMAPPMM